VAALDHYVQDMANPVEVRLDIIAIISNNNSLDIEHIKDAIYHF
jgi:putative endonuclease